MEAVGGLDGLISYYCSPDGRFEPKEFTNLLVSFGVEALHARFVYTVLSRWRTKAMGPMTESPAATSAITTSSVSTDSTPSALLDDLLDTPYSK
jgi:hypothetical protein